MTAFPARPLFLLQPQWREWLARHHGTETEVCVGFYKTGTGRPSMTWPQSVDEALCYGWIDGVRRRIDETSYQIRFTPRKRRSTWSAVNVRRITELAELGLVEPAGMAAFEQRTEGNTSVYSYENPPADLPTEYAETFHADSLAWNFFSAQAPSYRRACIWWVVSAKQAATRQKRLATLIEQSRAGHQLAAFRRRPSAISPAP
ncbi:MAG: YdeI/OmpD-associated family protein [Actinomycetota bacterium]